MLCMINVAAIISLRNLPLMSKYGFASVFFYLVAALVFFLPLSFVTAELATTWPEEGGVYTWVKEAFGIDLGFLAIWLDWIANAVFFPTLLSFIAASMAYVFNPALAHHPLYIFLVAMGVFWIATIVNLFGALVSGLISTIAVIIGTIIPGAFIIILALIWMLLGHQPEIHFSTSTFFPNFNLSNIVLFAGVILGLAGIEVASYHAREAINPQKEYPKAILLATLIIIGLFSLGSLAVAIVVPANEISLVAGILQAFQTFLMKFHLTWLTPIMAALITIGAIGMLSTWIIGPSQGLINTAQDGTIPELFQKENKNGVPTFVIFVQTVMASLFICVFLLLPNVNSAYWLLTAIASQVVVIMYILVFCACLRLRYSQKDKPRPFKIFGGHIGIWLITLIGVAACLFTLIIGFILPSNINISDTTLYESIMILGLLLLVGPPFVIGYFRRKVGFKKYQEK